MMPIIMPKAMPGDAHSVESGGARSITTSGESGAESPFAMLLAMLNALTVADENATKPDVEASSDIAEAMAAAVQNGNLSQFWATFLSQTLSETTEGEIPDDRMVMLEQSGISLPHDSQLMTPLLLRSAANSASTVLAAAEETIALGQAVTPLDDVVVFDASSEPVADGKSLNITADDRLPDATLNMLRGMMPAAEETAVSMDATVVNGSMNAAESLEAALSQTLAASRSEPEFEVAGPDDADSSTVRIHGTETKAASSTQFNHAAAMKTAESIIGSKDIGAVPLKELADVAVKTVRYMASNGQKTVTVKLVPESLGELRVEVSTGHNTVNVRLTSPNPEVRQALEHHAPVLREALARDNVNAVNVVISSDGSLGQTWSGQGSEPQTPMTMPKPVWSHHSKEAGLLVAALDSGHSRSRHDGNFDVWA